MEGAYEEGGGGGGGNNKVSYNVQDVSGEAAKHEKSKYLAVPHSRGRQPGLF